MTRERAWKKICINETAARARANKTCGVCLYHSGMACIVGLVMLTGEGAPTQNRVLKSWVQFGNAHSLQSAYVMLHRLKDRGFVAIDKEKNCNRIRLTAQGYLWLKVFEKGLKRRIK